MKNLNIPLFAVIVLISANAWSGPAEELMKVMGFYDRLPALLSAFRENEMIEAPGLVASESKLDMSKVIDQFAKQFESQFSNEEMVELTEFYRTDIGKASAKNDSETMRRLYDADPEQRAYVENIQNSPAFRKMPVAVPIIFNSVGEYIAQEYVRILSEDMIDDPRLQSELKRYCVLFYQARSGIDAYITCKPASKLDCPACQKAAGILDSMYPKIVHMM